MAANHSDQHNSSDHEMDGLVAMRLRLSNSRARRLLALCANSLEETVSAGQQLANRVTQLRDEIESLLEYVERSTPDPASDRGAPDSSAAR